MKLHNQIPLLLILLVIMMASISLYCNNRNHAIGQESNLKKFSEETNSKLFGNVQDDDAFCTKYLGLCPPNNDDLSNTKSQSGNENYTNEFAKKYAEKNSNVTISNQTQPLEPQNSINRTFTNETIYAQRPQNPDILTIPKPIPPTF